MEQPAPVKYVLYTHYNYREEDDFKTFRYARYLAYFKGSKYFKGLKHLALAKGTELKKIKTFADFGNINNLKFLTAIKAVEGFEDLADLEDFKNFLRWAAGHDFDFTFSFDQLPGIIYFRRHIKGLHSLLTSPAYEGNLIIFYAAGFSDCLNGIARGKSREDLLGQHRIKFSMEMGQILAKQLLSYPQLPARVRIITPIDLLDIFGRMNLATAENLHWWFIGKNKDIHYDTPKIVEAFLRLRMFGSGVPVFRLDYDVIFRGEDNENLPSLGLFKAIISCLRAYRLRMDDPGVATFLLSASYDTQALMPPENSNKFDAWRGAFATRVFPALPVVKTEIARARKHAGQVPSSWERYAQKVFDAQLARKFYGLSDSGLALKGLEGIGQIGGNPCGSIISGALLCLSDGAILDLPPFSNFTLYVMWIDDHLKYSLHRELRHLSSFRSAIEPQLSDAKLDQVMVRKARAPIKNLPEYVLGTYLPTLLWGTVLDAWINPDPVVKYRRRDLTPAKQDLWDKFNREGRSQGVLAAGLQSALEKGAFTKLDRNLLRDLLVEAGLKRITRVRRQWAGLSVMSGKGGKRAVKETFASVWAKGSVKEYFPYLDKKYYGIAHIGEEKVPVETPLTEVADLNQYQLHNDFSTLVDDALEYIEWTLNWPRIVQVVRSVKQGKVKTDLSWVPPV
ncbi:hypothetical protein SG34_002340 [Thalassomonas viridans]|uniref:Uncharacterized protein n=1 Tax=Thalassomonas viridans TaxID=137584 RepID=A0AAE9Z3V2_9GAMM|nr:hypothetical protein [Thalassomonas viridans]WDE05797.1 hypothetical protein SG34_002340 [Thalassomonas viridans]